MILAPVDRALPLALAHQALDDVLDARPVDIAATPVFELGEARHGDRRDVGQ
jgi:hypothetical protein